MQGFHLFHNGAGKGTRLLLAGKRRAGGRHVFEQMQADFGPDPGAGLEAGKFACPGHAGPTGHNYGEKYEKACQFRPRQRFDINAVDQVGDQGGLGDEQQTAAESQADG